MYFSRWVRDPMNPADAKPMNVGWQWVQINFEDIPETIRTKTLEGYCSNYLPTNTRSVNEDMTKPTGIESYGGRESVLMLDVDEGITIPMAKDIFDKYKLMIITTKRHTASNHRFRIIIELNRIIDCYFERLKIMEYIYKTYPFIDQKCKNCNRLFYTSPLDAEIYKFLDGELFNVDEIIDAGEPFKEKIPTEPVKDAQISTSAHPEGIYAWSELQECYINEWGEVLEGNHSGSDEESKLNGIQAFLDNEYIPGQRAMILYRSSCMMRDDGFDEEFIINYLLHEFNERGGEKMSVALQNIRGAFRGR